MQNTLSQVSSEELSNWLSDLIAINTINPPGSEVEAVKYIVDILEKEGIEYQIFSKEDTRANLFVRIKGDKQPAKFMLSAHLDVVPVEGSADSWRYPPLSGKIVDGEIWGRGAIDDKGMVAMILGVILEYQRSGKTPSRDITCLFLADEEKSGRLGAQYLVENHQEIFDAEIIINEGGGMIVENNGENLLLLNNSEKGAYKGYIQVKGTPGHGSVPRMADNAIIKASKLITRLDNHNTDIVPSQDILTQIEELGGGKIGRFLFSRNFTANLLINHPVSSLKELTPIIDAMIRPTLTPTKVEAGGKLNVIPGTAKIYLDCRMPPGQNWSDVEREVRSALGNDFDYKIHHLDKEINVPGSQSEIPYSLKQNIEEIMRKLDITCKVIPFQTTGATDSRYFRTVLDKPSFGLFPIIVDDIDEYSKMFHGINERISIDNLVFGTSFLYELTLTT